MTSASAISERAGRIELCVRVAPRASREGALGIHEGELKIALTSPPVDGEANASLVDFVAKTLGVAKREVRLVRGEKARSKVLSLPVESRAALEAWLATL